MTDRLQVTGRRLNRVIVYYICWFLGLITCTHAAAQVEERAAVTPAATINDVLPLDPAVTTGRLDNGLTYYIRRHGFPESRALLWLVVNAGSVLEHDDQQGLAHFVEHMAFNGTQRFEKNTMIDFAERAGIDFGADLNAYTTYDETVYMLTVPTDDESTLLTGLDILEDWAGALVFDEGEVERERGVVIEEWRRGRGARQRITDQQRGIMLQGSRYAERDTIGQKEILERAPVSALRRFYQDWYRPDLMAVIVAGDVDPEFIGEQVRLRFSDLKPRGSTDVRENISIPLIDNTRVSILTDEEASRSMLSLAIKGPRTPVRTEAEYREQLVQSLFSMLFNTRLDELRRTPDSPFMMAYTGISELGRTIDVYQLTAMPKPGYYKQSLETLLVELERIRRHGFLESEFDRQKSALLRFYERAQAERDKTDFRVLAREMVDHYLRQETMPGIDLELALVRKHLPEINLDEVNALASIWSGRNDRVITASGPAREVMPDAERLTAVVDLVAGADIRQYADTIVESDLLPVLPQPGSVIQEQRIEEIDVTVWTLSNGARVVLKPTTFKNDEVLMHALSPGGLSLVDDSDYHSAAAATGIVFEAGLGGHDAVQLGKMLAGKAVWVRPFISELEEGITGNAAVADLETMLQMIHLTFTGPRLDEKVFESWKERTATFVRNRDLNPQRVFSQELRAFSDNYHPRSLPLTLEDLQGISLQTAYSFVQDRYADASDFTFIFVGNVDPRQLRPLSETYLASLPADGRRETWRDVGIQPPTGTVDLKVDKGIDPKSMVRITYHGDAAWSYAVEADLRTLNDVIDIRLREVLREDLGGVYSASSSGIFYRLPRQRYTFSIGFDCAPENVDRLKQAVFGIIDAIKDKGISQDYIDKVRELRQRRLELNLKQNRYWLAQLVRHFRYGTEPAAIVPLEHQALERISSDNVRDAARFFLGDNRIDGLLMPTGG